MMAVANELFSTGTNLSPTGESITSLALIGAKASDDVNCVVTAQGLVHMFTYLAGTESSSGRPPRAAMRRA